MYLWLSGYYNKILCFEYTRQPCDCCVTMAFVRTVTLTTRFDIIDMHSGYLLSAGCGFCRQNTVAQYAGYT